MVGNMTSHNMSKQRKLLDACAAMLLLVKEGNNIFAVSNTLYQLLLTRQVHWCSGYHICFTRRRSWVQSPDEPYPWFFCFPKNLNHNSVVCMNFLTLIAAIFRKIGMALFDASITWSFLYTCLENWKHPRYGF